MQANRRLIKDVTDAAQVRAELRCEPNSLRLAAAQCRGRAIECQIREADLFKEPQP